jgi:hypothetical protein
MTKTIIFTLVFAALFMTTTIRPVTSVRADELNNADKKVHKALKGRTGTFCRKVLPAWFKQKRERDVEVFRTLVADCYLGHARLAILGVDSNLSLSEVGLSELPSALLTHETGMRLDVYRPLAGRTLKDFAKNN